MYSQILLSTFKIAESLETGQKFNRGPVKWIMAIHAMDMIP